MSTMLTGPTAANYFAAALLLALISIVLPPQAAAQDTATQSEQPTASVSESPAVEGGTTVSEAEKHFRQGVELYDKELYREALGEFERALALDPSLDTAMDYRDKALSKLELSAVGLDPGAVPQFEVFDPEAVSPGDETPLLSPEEKRIQRVRELLDLGDRYLEYRRYEAAMEYYSEVLLIAPDNKHARKGLHEATLGASKANIVEAEGKVAEDRLRMREAIERSKQLPEGADAFGVRQYRITVPGVEEEYEAPPSRSPAIEEALNSPVGIEFEGEHINNIMEFLADYLGVNIVVDARVVAPPVQVELGPAYATGGTGPGGGTGPAPYPGGPTRPNANMDWEEELELQSARRPQGQRPGPNLLGEYVTDGIVPYININSVPLSQALEALLRPLNLAYSVQPGFIWISTPRRIRNEPFEGLETRYYELKNAGAEAMPMMSSGMGMGMGMGGMGMGGMGGMGMGGMGGMGMGGMGMSGMSGMGMSGRSGMGMSGRSGMGGMGGYGGGMGGMGGYGGGMGGMSGGYGNRGGMGMSGGYGNRGGMGSSYGGRNTGGYGGRNTYGNVGGLSADTRPLALIEYLERIVDPVIERDPETGEEVQRSYIDFDASTNTLIVHHTPSAHAKIASQLLELDAEPRQVVIECKYLTITMSDLKSVGFQWNLALSDQNARSRRIEELEDETYEYDINGDGETEEIPFYSRPDGSPVISNTLSEGSAAFDALSGLATGDSPLTIIGSIIDSADGDTLGVTFQALSSLDHSELLSAPRVMALNNRPALFETVTDTHYIANVFSETETGDGNLTSSGNTVTTTNTLIGSVPDGQSLSVTPQITRDDKVRLWMNPSVMNLEGFTEVDTSSVIVDGVEESSATIQLPRLSRRQVLTSAIISSGETVVLGGHIQDSSFGNEDKVPYLAEIPVLGRLFRGKSRQVNQTSLLIFVTPEIVDSTGSRAFGSSN